MFSNILVATDLSVASDKAVSSLGGLKVLGVQEVLLIHCLNVRDEGGIASRLMELAAPVFEKQKKSLEGLGYKTSARMVQGVSHIEINRIADENRCDLIVLASQEQTVAGDLMLGGMACDVIHSAARPAMVLRPRLQGAGCEAAPCRPLEHVLFPTDFSENADYAFTYVEKIAECGAKRVTLLHVQNAERIERYLKNRLEEFNLIDKGRLERLRAELVKRGVRTVDIEIPYGSPKQEVIARTRKGDVSLVVLGSQGRGYISDIVLGSVSHAVVRHSAAPVLLIPAVR